APDMTQLAVLESAEDQRSDRMARRGGRDKAANHKFLPLGAFRFYPVLAASRLVRARSALGDHAFERQAACMPQDHFAVFLEVLAVAQRCRGGGKQLAQRLFALDERLGSKIFAIEMQQV